MVATPANELLMKLCLDGKYTLESPRVSSRKWAVVEPRPLASGKCAHLTPLLPNWHFCAPHPPLLSEAHCQSLITVKISYTETFKDGVLFVLMITSGFRGLEKMLGCTVTYFRLPGLWSFGDSLPLWIFLSLFSISSPPTHACVHNGNRLKSEYIQDFVQLRK